MKKNLLLLAAAMMVANPDTPAGNDVRAYVLNEGLWGGNDASLSLITKEGITNDWFAQNNGRGLGDLGQDMVHYGSLLYVVVHSSSTLECVDPTTGISRKQIDLSNRKPRYLVGHEGKLYVSCYDKTVVRIDTATLAVDGICQLSGMQPEQLCIVGNNLYVCNGSRLIVACGGDYASHPACTKVVNVSTGSQTQLDVAATNFDIYDGAIYLYCTTYDASWNTTVSFYKVDANTLSHEEILADHKNELKNAYAINVDPKTKNIYICNSVYGVNSDVYVFSPAGAQLNKYEAGTFANKVVF